MPKAQRDALDFWVRNTLAVDPVRIVDFATAIGGTNERELQQKVGPDITFTPTLEQLRGALILAETYPSWSSVQNPLGGWTFGVVYRGVPDSKDAELANLITEL